jgi:GGDEF domain-containing protein
MLFDHDAAGCPDDRLGVLRRDEFEWRLARALETLQDGDAHALLLIDLRGASDAGAPGDLSARLYAQVRGHDMLACIDECQVALLLEHCPQTIARERAEALRATLAGRRAGVEKQSPVNIGVAAICNRPQTPQAAIAAAQAACARAGGPACIGEIALE